MDESRVPSAVSKMTAGVTVSARIAGLALLSQFASMRWLVLFFLTFTLSTWAQESEEPDTTTDQAQEEEPTQGTVDDSVTIDGQQIDYTVTASKLTLKKDDDTPQADIFYVSYIRKNVGPDSVRPILFAFNGGPGSSAVWLHLGALGPKIVQTSPDGTEALPPPVLLQDNPLSILDVTDLVFIDPVSTGYSRKDKDAKNSDFHGVSADINSVADFIRRWITENDRWNSPKYLLGESYGGIRAAGLSNRLQDRYGMSLNGVVLLSSLLDFRTLRPGEGDFIDSIIFLPVMTATAHYHGKISGDRDQLITRSNTFAKGPYATALLQGNELPEEEISRVSEELSTLTGVPAQLWKESHLRLSPSRFRRELLRDQDKVIGRFDSRVAWPARNNNSDYPSFDPSYAVAHGAFSTAMLDFLSRTLSYEETRPYEILTGNVHPWNYGKGNSYVNLTSDLATALLENPNLKVLVQCGRTDLATPPQGMLYSLRQAYLPETSQDRITVEWYDAGHMFYLNQPDLEKMRTDLVQFIRQTP